MTQFLEAAPDLKWLVYGVLALIGLVGLYGLFHALAKGFGHAGRRRPGLLGWLERFFRRLTHVPRRKPRRPRVRVDRDIATCATYRNPLHGPGTLREKILYSYEAFCALALDLGVPRETGQTPFEYFDRLPEPIHGLADEARTLTHLYVAGAYSTLPLPESAQAELQRFWRGYESARARVLR